MRLAPLDTRVLCGGQGAVWCGCVRRTGARALLLRRVTRHVPEIVADKEHAVAFLIKVERLRCQAVRCADICERVN